MLCHPLIIGELSCGSIRNWVELPRLLASLPEARVAEHEEVLHFVEARRLHSRGLGWIDAYLLASAVLTNVPLWIRDRRLRDATVMLGFAAEL